MSTLSDISSQIRERRLELGLSLTQLSRRADTSAATLSRYENGWSRFEVSTLRKLATALRCELVVEMKHREENPNHSTRSEMVERLRRLFWDQELTERHLEENSIWVVERVLEYGSLEDIHLVIGFLGREGFLRNVSEARFSTERTRVFWEQILKKEGMTCTRRFSRNEAATSWRSSKD